jgi:signal transduction histidine kinase
MLSVATLHRVDAITRTANAIIEGDLSSRVPLRGTGDDLDRLAETLNRMLDRISGLLENLRQVSNDIAHDLRTPLTRLRNRLSSASTLEDPAERGRAVESAIVETDGILDTFTALLRIAQLESGTRKAGFRPVDLSLLMARLAEDYRPAAEDEGKSLAAAIQPGISTIGDKELLTHMVANLIDNAIQHTAAGTKILVTLASVESAPVVEVADDGVGVPEDEREKVFRRFYRLDRSRTTDGSGLGLAFVAAVAELHRVEIKMLDNSPGLRVRLQFPRPSAPISLPAANRPNGMSDL